jgi:hypothetical protein
MTSYHKRFALSAAVGAAAMLVSFAGCTGRPKLQERSTSSVAFTDTAWHRAHCVTADTLHPDLTSCVLRDQSVPQRRPFGTGPLVAPRARRP